MPNCLSIPMPNPPSLLLRRPIASRRKKCAGAEAVIAAGAEGTGAGVAGTGVGAAAVGVAGIGAGIVAGVGVAAIGVVVTGKTPAVIIYEELKKPRVSGAFVRGNINKRGSVHNATRCRKDTRDRDAPTTGAGATTTGERRRPGGWAGNRHRDRDAIRAACARGFRRAEAGNGAQGQNCCEKVFHVLRFLPFLAARAAQFGT